MNDSIQVLSSSSLNVALAELDLAVSDSDKRIALVSAASLLQHAVLSGQAAQSISAALSSCSPELAVYLEQVLNRAVDFHLQDDGGTLGLWLVPVVCNASNPLPDEISLSTAGLDMTKLMGILSKTMKLVPAGVAATGYGWSYVVPELYSESRIASCDLADLINFPTHVRAVVKGERAHAKFKAGRAEADDQSIKLFFLPVVAYHPAGTEIVLPVPSEHLVYRLTRWLEKSLSVNDWEDFSFRVAEQPHPFSIALAHGRRMHREATFRGVIGNLADKTGVDINGMAALVAAYRIEHDPALQIGVSLVARMTKTVVSTISFESSTTDGVEDVALITYILRSMGMDCIQHEANPLNTYICQHCGNMQFSLPHMDLTLKGISDPCTTMQ